jgi:hypothetical protein
MEALVMIGTTAMFVIVLLGMQASIVNWTWLYAIQVIKWLNIYLLNIVYYLSNTQEVETNVTMGASALKEGDSTLHATVHRDGKVASVASKLMNVKVHRVWMVEFAWTKLRHMLASVPWDLLGQTVRRTSKFVTILHVKTALYVWWKRASLCVIVCPISMVRNASINTTNVKLDRGK